MIQNLVVSIFILLLSNTVFGNPAVGVCSAMKSHYNSVSDADKQRLLRSCKETYTPGAGWTNSATGCGRCPKNYNPCDIYSSECTAVKALEALGGAVSNWTQRKNGEYLGEANEKVTNLQLAFISKRPDEEVELYTPTVNMTPSLGERNSVGVNELVTVTTSGFYAECVLPLFSYEQKKMGGYLHSLKANSPLCKLERSDKVFHGNYFNKIKQATGIPSAAFPYMIKKKKKGVDICQREMGMSFACSKRNPTERFIFGWGFVSSSVSRSDRVWFRGGDSTSVFLEVLDGLVTRKFIHDLSSGREFNCGGYTLQIEYADGEVMTFMREKGSVSDLSATCESEIFGDFLNLSPPKSKESLKSRIQSLIDMQDMGLLSEEEFEAKKQEILLEI